MLTRDCEMMIDRLNMEYNNLVELMKQETEPKKIKMYEAEISKNLMLSKSLQTYVNYYRIRDAKKS